MNNPNVENNENDENIANDEALNDENVITRETIELENNSFEINILNWLRFIFMIFTTAIALINFTRISHLYALLMFIIGLLLLAVRIINYFSEKSRLNVMGIGVRFRINVLMYSMIPVFFFMFWILFKL